MKLLTFGYVGRSAEALAGTLARMPGALLVDVRISPRSRAAEWAGPALRHRFGARYLHLRQFGNLNYQSDAPVQLADGPGGVRALLAATRPLLHQGDPLTVVLLCACPDRGRCHRDDVARLLVRQLAAEDAGELTPTPPPPPQLALW